MKPKNFLINFAIVLLAVGLVLGGAFLDRQFHFGFLDRFSSSSDISPSEALVVEQRRPQER